MPDHLLLPARRIVPSRRTNPGSGSPPTRERAQHGARLRRELDNLVRAPSRLREGVDPDLVFKIRADGVRFEDTAHLRGITVLAETRDHAYVVLSHDEGAKLRAALDGYTRSGALGSLLDRVNAIEEYGPEDRRGPGLNDVPENEPFLVDITIWPAWDYPEAARRAWTVQTVLAEAGATEVLRSLSARRNLVRVLISRAGLDAVLATSVVEQVRTPPVPFLDYHDWRSRAAADLSRTEVPSATVGVLDDAPATGHPLLAGLVESIDSIGPGDYRWTVPGHHGTEVVGRVLFPGLDEDLRTSSPIRAHGTVRVARILEPDPATSKAAPRFAGRNFPHELVEQGIRKLHADYGVRIFNMSAGYPEPYADAHVGALAEIIDELVRELDIVVVVPTGNAPPSLIGASTPSGHHVADDYAAYLDAPEHRLAEPGQAALAVTVGSLALSEAPAEIGDSGGRFAWEVVAEVDQLSPFSRTGPGVGANAKRRNKPDLVHYGGNVVLNDMGLVVSDEPGASIISTALDVGTGRLFAACNGTSFAAPAVARIAADILHAYPEASANLVRALLALSARLPDAARDIPEEHRVAALFGNGRPDTVRAITSGGARATMIFDGSMDVDTVAIHPVPIPEAFRTGRRSRTITVTLAFDPPVRRTRREYLGASMQVDLYRSIAMDELVEVLSKQDQDEAVPMIRGRRRTSLVPGSEAMVSSTLQSRTWKATQSFIDDGDVFLLAVTHRASAWLRDQPAEYPDQNYALAVTLDDEHLLHVDLRRLLLEQTRVPARVRIRS